MKKIIVISAITVGIGILSFFMVGKGFISSLPVPQHFWDITSVDTIKYSRDSARVDSFAKIPFLVGKAAKLHATHIAIDTPYDEEFYPVLKAWVDEARKDHLKVWFRGNFSAWEGWFGYQKFTDISQHHVLTKAFILKHPGLFQDGDIFTPVPEPENGGFGDPRGSDQKSSDFNSFLIASYNNCVSSFSQINIQVSCGFFSTNGDIAKMVLTPSTVSQIGNVVVIDHYVSTSSQMQSDLDYLANKFPNAKIVLGEFGAPIPDINGSMTEEQQATFLDSLFQVFSVNRKRILGINYWTLAGGSTSLLRDDFSEKKAFQIVSNYFLPSQLQGKVVNTLGDSLGNINVYDKNNALLAQTGSNGNFSIAVQNNTMISLHIAPDSYKSFDQTILISQNPKNLQDIKLEPLNPDFLYRIRLFFANLFSL